MPFYDLICANGHEQIDQLLTVSDHNPPCHCGAHTQTLWRGRATAVIGDDIPGGVWINHGLCNEDGTPRKYYSHSEMAAERKRRGLRLSDEHVCVPGTDKNPHTSRWI